jgi:predicted anti-sigma-YlaC factor YlaD
MLTCKDASHLISEGQDRHLRLRERISLRLHLGMCSSCRRFEQQINYIHRTLRHGWLQGKLPEEKPLSPDARERIRKKLESHSRNSSN